MHTCGDANHKNINQTQLAPGRYALTSYPVAFNMESNMTALNTNNLELDAATGVLPDLVGVPRTGSTVNAQGLSVTFVEFGV